MRGSMMALYVATIVSFCCPQSVPVRALRIARRSLHLSTVFSTCLWKQKSGSKVIPSIFGNFSSGSGVPLSGIWGWRLYWRLSEVKSVTVDFWVDICRSRSPAQVATSCAWLAKARVVKKAAFFEMQKKRQKKRAFFGFFCFLWFFLADLPNFFLIQYMIILAVSRQC